MKFNVRVMHSRQDMQRDFSQSFLLVLHFSNCLSLINPSSSNVPYFIILLCLTPDILLCLTPDVFTHQSGKVLPLNGLICPCTLLTLQVALRPSYFIILLYFCKQGLRGRVLPLNGLKYRINFKPHMLTAQCIHLSMHA